MTILKTQQKSIYFLLLTLAAGLFVTAIGPGLFHSHSPVIWQYRFFDLLCHQDVHRSFSMHGVQMAVCSRCFGIYSCFLLGILVMPIFSYVTNFSTKLMIRVLVGIIVLNILDVAANAFGIWSNTLNSRFVLGGILGLAAALLLTNEFFIKITKSEEYYGK